MNVYTVNETRPEGQRAVVFFRQTYAVRLFETEGRIYETYSRNASRRNLFLCADDLTKVLSVRAMDHHVVQLTTAHETVHHDARDRPAARPDYDPDDRASVSRALWEVLQAVGDLVSNRLGQQKKRQNTYEIDLGFAESPEGAGLLAKMPKQARVLSGSVVSLGKASVEEDEMRSLVEHLHAVGSLKTKSDPWTIFRFYCPQFYDMGLMKYKGRRLSEAEDGEESAYEAA